MGFMAKTDLAFDMLYRDIVSGTHRPGQPLRISSLSALYGVSATPLREALSRLEAKQLVVGSANRGWRVAPVSLAEFEDLQIARLEIERSLLRDAMRHGDVEWESGIVGAHHRLAQTTPPVGEDDRVEVRQVWIEAHDAFHLAILSAARSGWLKTFYAQVAEQLQRHHQALLFHTGAAVGPDRRAETDEMLRTALSIPRHTELMEVVLSRDVPAAIRALTAHVGLTRAIYRSFIGAHLENQDQATGERP